MKKISLLICIILPFLLTAQVNLKNIRHKSYRTFAFRISAADTEKFILDYNVPVDRFLNEQPVYSFHKDSVDTDVLPLGHYVLISSDEGQLITVLIERSNLIVTPVNNEFNIQLDIRNKNGEFIDNAEVWINNQKARYHLKAKNYWAAQRKIEEGIVKIFTQNDTCFLELEQEDDVVSPLKQRWDEFKRKLPKKKSKTRYKYVSTTGASGYILFNQPKYKLTDTVKLKAYVVNSKWKRYKEKLSLYLEYYANGKQSQQLLSNISPVSRGSYVYSFPLSDTLVSDMSYNIIFRDKNGKSVISKYFRTEDYLLEEIGAYQFHAGKEDYYRKDTMCFYASAKDANNLPVLDGRAKLVLLTKSINRFYADTIQVPDTLYSQEKLMETTSETIFEIPAAIFPQVDLGIEAKLIFRNSNNETHEETASVYYSSRANELIVTTIRDSLFAEYKIDGRSIDTVGEVEISGDLIDKIEKIRFPVKMKIDPLADEYTFNIYNNKDTISESIDIEDRYELIFSRINNGDTTGFSLYNPYKIPVNFLVLDGDKLVYAGKDEKEIISWTGLLSRRKIYRVKWQYSWAGSQKEYTESIAVLYKLLNIQVKNSETIFPGQKDTITVEIKDFKNRPAEEVNISAVSYNSQFKKDISVKEPPYLVRYKHRLNIIRQRSEIDEAYLVKKYWLSDHLQWKNRFTLDTMPFYKMLFPSKFPYYVSSPISQLIPQLSMHVVQKGRPVEIFLLYINRQLAYYNGVTDRMSYSFQAMPGYAQVGIRLHNQYLQIDSLYLQPSYKHDIVIDLDSLPAHSVVRPMPEYWTSDEIKLIENSIYQLDRIDKTGYAYIWQNDKVIKLDRGRRHLVGPFNTRDSLHFFEPRGFDIHFLFEPGYEYNLSRQTTRLERRSIFPDRLKKNNLEKEKSLYFILGDTILFPPEIIYPPKNSQIKALPITSLSQYFRFVSEKGTAQLQFETAKDTLLKYIILYNPDTLYSNLILGGDRRKIDAIKPGNYSLLLVNNQFEVAEMKGLVFKAGQTLCLQTKYVAFKKENAVLNKLLEEINERNNPRITVKIKSDSVSLPTYPKGNCFIKGKVIDAKGGNAIVGASISIVGMFTGTVSSSDGHFEINNLRDGKYTLLVTAIGYLEKLIQVTVSPGQEIVVNPSLLISEDAALEEVVVSGYTASSKRNMLGSVAVVNAKEMSLITANALQGRAAGLDISPGSGENVKIRGLSNLSGDNLPIYVIDGIIYDKMPGHIKPEMISSIEVLKDPSAITIYGAKGINGVIIITTGTKAFRDKLQDYGFWQPELFTNEEGKVSFEVKYPDNVTGWEIYVLGMDRKRRMGKGMSFAKAYKPMVAQLNTPQFLVEGDSALIVGKSLNYTKDGYSINTSFSVNGQLIKKQENLLTANASLVNYFPVIAKQNDADSGKESQDIIMSFDLESATGFRDGEERKIPVFRIGSKETKGSFYVLPSDTAFNFSPVLDAGPIEVYAQNNTLDVLLSELKYLKQYPYYCMEQTASKLTGLLLEKNIKEQINQPAGNQKEITFLVKKLQESQLFDGGWGWWEKGKANVPITAYVIEALLPLRKDPLVESTIRNALLFLQNQLSDVSRESLLQILSCFSRANHVIDYTSYLSRLSFDSLTHHQQWQWVQICQQQKLDHGVELEKLIKKKTGTMTGGVHWGTETYRWYNNTIATTLLAYDVLNRDKNYQYLLAGIVQYFLEQRHNSYWRNTVESAAIVSTILPHVLKNNKSSQQPASINIEGDTSIIIKSFPYHTKLPASNIFTIRKTGAGISYLTFYQKWWNKQPEPVSDNFIIQSYFEKNGHKLETIVSGEKIKMVVKVNVSKDANYVMIEIPIPAGCNYAGKKQEDWKMHKEYFKNKVVLFAEFLEKGGHVFEIDLEPRYKGKFTLNPAKAELMYFPTFYGRSRTEEVNIE